MREEMAGAIRSAKQAMYGAINSLHSTEMTDQEAMQRYLEEHRGRPEAIIAFAREMAPGNIVEKAVEYEREMEAMLRRNGYE